MGMRIRFQYPTGRTLGYSIERLADGFLFDPSDSTFKASPASPVAPLPEDVGVFAGRYKVTLTPTPVAQFADGDYAITIHDVGGSGRVVGQLACLFRSGDDATAAVSSGGTGPYPTALDPWATYLSQGNYPAGTAGAILGLNLDAKVSTRSTYAGGPVASVTAPVVVGTVADKSGYSLAPSGLDAIPVEPGINVRQALAPILASAAGVLSGAGTGTIVIRGANGSTSRITASTDNAGNRSSVTLTLPG